MNPADRDAVHDLKSRYFYYVDTKQWEALRTVFTDDARFEGFVSQPNGPDEFVAGVASFLAGVSSVHYGFMPLMEAQSDSLIRARWSMYDDLSWSPGTKRLAGDGSDDLSGRRGSGYYEEEYRRLRGGWRISYMRLTRLRVELVHGLRHESSDLLAPDLGWLD